MDGQQVFALIVEKSVMCGVKCIFAWGMFSKNTLRNERSN